MLTLFGLFITSTAVAVLPPWRIARHFALGFTLLAVLLWLVWPPVHHSDQGWAHGLVILTVLALLVTLALPLLIRVIWTIHKRRLDLRITTTFDAGMAAITGVVLALLVFIHLSYVTASQPPFAGHFIACVIAVCTWVLRHPTARGFALGFALLTLYSLSYPLIVQSAAKQAAGVAPFMIFIPYSGFDTPASMTFLSMPKWPHASLQIQGADKTTVLGWSYRNNAFLPIRH